jgi:hypothetical protein
MATTLSVLKYVVPLNRTHVEWWETVAHGAAMGSWGARTRRHPAPKPRDPWRLPTAHGWSRHPHAVESRSRFANVQLPKLFP